MNDLYGDLEEDLRKWFGRKGAPGKKKGWVDCNTCRKDKKTGKKKCSACGRSSGEKRSKYPSCRPTPSACGKRGNWGKKSKAGKKGGKSKKNEELQNMELYELVEEELLSFIGESYTEKHEKELEKIADELAGASKMHKGQSDRIKKVLDQTDDEELKEEEVTEGMNCGCGQDPCETYGKNNEKLVIMVKEELDSVMNEGFMDSIINRKTHKIGKEAIAQLQGYASNPSADVDIINSIYDELNKIEKENSPAADSVYDALELARGLMKKAEASGSSSYSSSPTRNTRSSSQVDTGVAAARRRREREADAKREKERRDAEYRRRRAVDQRIGRDYSQRSGYAGLEEIVKEELEAVLGEKRKKKKKKKSSGKKDACYHKVKSRYKVWPSAYASGALVKCRKVGAKNWGNSKKEQLQAMVEDELSTLLEFEEESLEEKKSSKCTKVTKKASSTRKGKKWMKCVKSDSGGYKRIHWGQAGVRVTGKSGNTKRKKSFKARHGCKGAKANTPKGQACKDWAE